MENRNVYDLSKSYRIFTKIAMKNIKWLEVIMMVLKI